MSHDGCRVHSYTDYRTQVPTWRFRISEMVVAR